MLRAISLFTGAGGLDYGLEAAGFTTTVAVEMNRHACATLRANRPWTVLEGDLHGFATATILEAGGLDEVELLAGGPPCQPFSKSGYWAAGDSARLNDPRSLTLDAYLRVLEEARPRAFLLENVEGLAYAGKSEGLDLLLSRIEAINQRCGTNYRPGYRVLHAAEHGVPQMRSRFFLLGARDGAPFAFPEPRMVSPRTAWDALVDVRPDPEERLAVSGRWAELLPSIPEGQNYLYHTERGQGLPLFGWRRRFWSFLLKLAKNRPSWTIQAQPGPAVGPFHWENRRLSRRELCRLQTFPDDVHVLGNLTEVQRQVGNAVPSLLAERLGRAIRVSFFGEPNDESHPVLLPPQRSDTPPPEPVATVPERYRGLAGEHTAHPGTGKGFRSRRSGDTPLGR